MMTATAPAIDSTPLALISIFGGALLTVLAGLLGAWIQARREHARWIREERLKAYAAFLAVIEDTVGAMVLRRFRKPRVGEVTEALQRTVAGIYLVGPAEIADTSADLRGLVLRPMVETWQEDDMASWIEQCNKLRDKYLKQAQGALRISSKK